MCHFNEHQCKVTKLAGYYTGECQRVSRCVKLHLQKTTNSRQCIKSHNTFSALAIALACDDPRAGVETAQVNCCRMRVLFIVISQRCLKQSEERIKEILWPSSDETQAQKAVIIIIKKKILLTDI